MKARSKQRESLGQILKRTAEVLYPAGALEDVTVATRDSDGDTPLHKVALWGDSYAIEALVEAGAEVDAKGDMGCTPLYYAVMEGHLRAVERLLELGANPACRTELGMTPSELARRSGNKELIQMFRAPIARPPVWRR